MLPDRRSPNEYLIEVPHSPEECAAAPATAAGTGVGPVRAYRGCDDGTHTTWIVAELSSKGDAWSLVPKLLRDTARVTRVGRVVPASGATGGKDGRST